MSSNFDYPPASTRPPRGTVTDRLQPRPALRLQHLRDLLSSERIHDRAGHSTVHALETINQEIDELLSDRSRNLISFEDIDPPNQRPYQRMEDLSTRRTDRIRRRVLDDDRDPNSPPTSNPTGIMEQEPISRQRRRGLRPSETLSRVRDGRMRGANVDLDGLQALQPAPARIRDGDSTISSILEDPISRIGSPNLTPQDYYAVDPPVSRWRAKRRKLESDDNREGLRGFSYGQFGQVVPGALKMEIISCDGGAYPELSGERSWANNDSGIYTKRDRCNLVLRHRGETPFCLKKIVIKAPKVGYDGPIQEGMIFVSMASDELLARTHRGRRSGTQASQEYLNGFRAPLRSLDRTVLTDPGLYSDSDMEPSAPTAPRSGGPNYPVSMSDSSASEFRITTSFEEKSEDDDDDDDDDDSGNEGDSPSAAEMGRMNLAQLEEDTLCPEEDESESDDDTNEPSYFSRTHFERRTQMRTARRQNNLNAPIFLRRRRASSFMEAASSTSRDNLSGPLQSPDVLKPHARFSIGRDKSMVSIKFDPPPSGRFILIKLWSPSRGGHIDIESVVVHGFAGPRFFPAGGFR